MRPIILLLLCNASSAAIFASTGDTTFYNYVNSGKTVGKEWVVQKEKNSFDFYDEYNDRGRGPAVYTHIQTDDKGVIISAAYSGFDYYKSSVNEKFYIQGQKAYWKNRFENDSSFFRNELYSAMNGPLAEESLILRMLQTTSTNGEIQLLPSGLLRYRRLTSIDIATTPSQGGAGASSPAQVQSLQLIAFTGSGYTPDYFWFTNDGQFFGAVSSWFSLIAKGYEGSINDLLTAQKPYEEKFFTDLAVSMTENPAAGLGITNTTVFDPQSGLTYPHQTVLIQKDHVVKKGNTSDIVIPAGYKVIDGTGKFLMPGLWDMHCHFQMSQGPFMLAQGVTNIRDMGNDFELLHTRQMINTDSILGPSIIYISGFIDKAGPMAGPTGVLVNSLQEALKAVDDYKSKGYDQIKLYSSIEPGWVQPIAAKAHGLGMRVCGHIPAYMTASQAVDAGYDEITHINMIVLNFFGDTIDTRNMTRLTLPGQKGFTIDVKGKAFQTFIEQLKAHHTAVDPTLSTFEDEETQMAGELSKQYVGIESYLPPKVRRDAMNSSYIGTDSQIDVYARSFRNMGRMVKELYDNGIIILAGTDVGILQHELELYSAAGIPNAAALKMATYWPAKLSGKDKVLGTVEEGKIADLVLIEGNPLERMSDIRKVYVTIKEGKLYWPKEIYKQFGWGYYY
jgi:hypothetical protein